ncbi:cytochrome P450 [Musa troglodytarum]|uniref:Cytochrome P450 n=1 Tax=Musa troglodytarum TaxID=320322 RepID=A0A9E7HJ90_9LILI|nr:cytochrome P450 [Musa troglodytarum]
MRRLCLRLPPLSSSPSLSSGSTPAACVGALHSRPIDPPTPGARSSPFPVPPRTVSSPGSPSRSKPPTWWPSPSASHASSCQATPTHPGRSSTARPSPIALSISLQAPLPPGNGLRAFRRVLAQSQEDLRHLSVQCDEDRRLRGA